MVQIQAQYQVPMQGVLSIPCWMNQTLPAQRPLHPAASQGDAAELVICSDFVCPLVPFLLVPFLGFHSCKACKCTLYMYTHHYRRHELTLLCSLVSIRKNRFFNHFGFTKLHKCKTHAHQTHTQIGTFSF